MMSDDRLQLLRTLTFGQRVAEEEGETLAGYFVETEHWRKLYADEIDIVYGPKGAGKSALYALLNSKQSDLFDRSVVLVAAENPRGAPAFEGLVDDPPASEREFIGLWKLYFACLLCGAIDEYQIHGSDADALREALADEGLIRGGISLQKLLRRVVSYAKRYMCPSAIEAGVTLDPATQAPVGVAGRIVLQQNEATSDDRVTPVDDLLGMADRALQRSGISVWITLDRLDVAFAENPQLEQNALRALFKTYLDMSGHRSLRLKVFLRTDIWDRVTATGFREASHVTRHITISWSEGNCSILLFAGLRKMIACCNTMR